MVDRDSIELTIPSSAAPMGPPRLGGGCGLLSAINPYAVGGENAEASHHANLTVQGQAEQDSKGNKMCLAVLAGLAVVITTLVALQASGVKILA